MKKKYLAVLMGIMVTSTAVPATTFAEDVSTTTEADTAQEQKVTNEAPDGQAPEKPEGETPDGQAPEKPEGEAPDGQAPEKPEGEAPMDRLLKNRKVRFRTDKAVLMAVSLKAWIATPLSMNIQKIPLLKIQPLNPQEPMKMQL